MLHRDGIMSTETLKPGPETDARVAVEVMGWTPEYWGYSDQVRRWQRGGVDIAHGSWSPSTNIAAAMNEVLPKLAADGWSYIVGHDQADSEQRFCRLWKHTEEPRPTDMKREHVITRHAKRTPMAICEVALEAVKEKR